MKYICRIFEVFEDNAKLYHFAVVRIDGECVYYHICNDIDPLFDAAHALGVGGDPIVDGWEGGEINPDACYQKIIAALGAHDNNIGEIFLYAFVPDQGEPELFPPELFGR